MTKIFQYAAIAIFFTSCTNVLLQKYREDELTIDTQENQYLSYEIISEEVNDFTLKASIEFKKSYRDNCTNWAGFFIKTDKINGKHTEDCGYNFFVRENGEIGIHSSPTREIREQTSLYPIKPNKTREVIIRCKNSTAKFYVDNNLIYKVENLKLKGNYISANVGGSISTFNIDYIKSK